MGQLLISEARLLAGHGISDAMCTMPVPAALTAALTGATAGILDDG
jgi:hypothetical protein